MTWTGPAPLVFAGIGFALSGTSILPRALARTAVLIAGLFLIAGLAAGTPHLQPVCEAELS